MRLLLLGSGIASGLPAWNDGGERALRARAGDPRVPARRAAALAVSADGLRYSILEAPFHLASSLIERPRFAPAAGSRSVPIDALVLTSGELDASAGALALRSGLAARVFSPTDLREALVQHDASFAALAASWSGVGWDRPFTLDREEQIEARLFPLAGPPPDHLSGESNGDRPDGLSARAGAAAGRARCGVRLTDRRSGTRVVWAPRIAAWDSATLAELRAADVRFVDGTCFDDDEARRIRPGARSARLLGHAPIDGREGSLVRLAGMSGRSIYVHLAASNPICDADSKQTPRVLTAGVEIGHDGLELTL